MARKVAFTVKGIQEPCGSKRAVGRGRYTLIIDANKRAPRWKRVVAEAAELAVKDSIGKGELLQGPLSMSITFQRERPKYHTTKTGKPTPKWTEYPVVMPDTTKLIRGTEDAMTGIVYADDAQIVSQRAYKIYGDSFLTKISVEEMECQAANTIPAIGSSAKVTKHSAEFVAHGSGTTKMTASKSGKRRSK